MSVPTTFAVLAGLIALCSCGAEKDAPSPSGALDGDLEPMESVITYHTPDYQAHLRQVLIDAGGNLNLTHPATET